MTLETIILADGSEVTLIHFLVIPKYGRQFLACMPGLEDFAQSREIGRPIFRTDECRSITCPMCKATTAHRKALEAIRR
jgi:hypothetical protein